MTTYEVFQPRHSDPETLRAQPPAEGIVLHNGEVVTSAFLVKDGLIRAWLRRSVLQEEMTSEEAEKVYKRWNPDPEFQVSDLLG